MQIRYAASMPRAFIVQFMNQIEAWANKLPVNSSNETQDFGNVRLMRREWDNHMNVCPVAQMDEWMLHRWDTGFVGVDPNDIFADTMRRKL